MSKIVWIPTLWMFYIATKPIAVWFGVPGDPDGGGSPLDRRFLIGLLCIGLFILFWKKCNWVTIFKENKWFILIIGYMFVSIIWSDIPFISLKRWVREVLAVIMALIITTEQEPHKAIQCIFRRMVYVLIPFSILLIKYYRDLGVLYVHHIGLLMWTGVSLHKNGLCRLCLISLFYLLWTFIRRRQRRDIPVTKYQKYVEIFMFLLSMWLIMGPEHTITYSATSIGVLSAGILVLLGLIWLNKNKINIGSNTLMAITTFIILVGIFTVIDKGSFISNFSSIFERDATLTGRVDIWANIMPSVMQRPILGHGFGGFWTPSTIENLKVTECHNGYLEIILEMGFVGLILFSFFLLSNCRKAIKELKHDFDWACLWISFIIITVLYNITESSLDTFTSPLTAILLFLSVSGSVNTSYTKGV